MSGMYQLLLLAGTCLCFLGAAVQVQNVNHAVIRLERAPQSARDASQVTPDKTSGEETVLDRGHETMGSGIRTNNWDAFNEPREGVQEAKTRRIEAKMINGTFVLGDLEKLDDTDFTGERRKLDRDRRSTSSMGRRRTSEVRSSSSDSPITIKPRVVSLVDSRETRAPLTPTCEGRSKSSLWAQTSDGIRHKTKRRQKRQQAETTTLSGATPLSLRENPNPHDRQASTQFPPLILNSPEDVKVHESGKPNSRDVATTGQRLFSKTNLNQPVTAQTDHEPTNSPDLAPPKQTSGKDPVSSSGPSLPQWKVETEREDHADTEELDEDEDHSEESEEEDSDEEDDDQGEPSFTQQPSGYIPPPPVWVQGNQGLMRSWTELVREKAGHVSGMLVPVGIGITGSLMIVGVLYSARVFYYKIESFREVRRKVRQPEQLHEHSPELQDQAMLLVNSSEDEL